MRRSLVLALVLAVAVPASAREPTETASSTRWYGWQILLVDGVCIGLFASLPAWANGEASATAGVLDFVAFTAASPGIHAAHGDDAGGLVSLGLHLGLPAASALLGVGIGASGHRSTCSTTTNALCGLDDFGAIGREMATGAWVGTLVGGGLAALVDAVVLAWEREGPRATVSWTLAPLAFPSGGGLGVGGTF